MPLPFLTENRILLGDKPTRLAGRIADVVLKITLVLLPLPIFFDFSLMRIHLSDLTINRRVPHLDFPLPLGFMALLFVGLLLVLLYHRDLLRLVTKVDFFLASLIGVYALFCLLSGYSFVALMQLLSFPVLLFSFSFFEIKGGIARFYIAGLLSFGVLHFISVLYNAGWDLGTVWPRTRWERIFNYEIYQGLVSYVNVLGLGALVFLMKIGTASKLKQSIFYAMAFALLMYLAALSSQRAYVLDLAVFTLWLAFIIVFGKRVPRTKKVLLTSLLVAVWLLSIFAVNNTMGSPVIRLARTIYNINTENFDADTARLFSQTEAIESLKEIVIQPEAEVRVETPAPAESQLQTVIPETTETTGKTPSRSWWKRIFVGTGVVHSGAHNFFLDQLIGVGPFGAACYFLFLLFSALKLGFPWFKSRPIVLSSYFLVLLVMAFLANMVNSPFTQPFYFSNLIIVSMIMLGTLQEDNTCKKPR